MALSIMMANGGAHPLPPPSILSPDPTFVTYEELSNPGTRRYGYPATLNTRSKSRSGLGVRGKLKAFRNWLKAFIWK